MVDKKKYSKMVEKQTKNSPLFKDCIKAFIIGGIICTIGQGINDLYMKFDMGKTEAQTMTSVTLVFIGVLLTALHLYEKIAKHGGAGTLVPITGFANSVAASAIEFKKEGQVFGIGCKIFTIAGPVILYGLFSSWLLGLIYYIIRMWGIL